MIKLLCQVILEQAHDVFPALFCTMVFYCTVVFYCTDRKLQIMFHIHRSCKDVVFYKLTCLQCKLPSMFTNNNHQSRQL